LTVTAVKDALSGYYNRRAKELMKIVKEQVVAEELKQRRRPHLEQTAKRKAELDKIHTDIYLQDMQIQILRQHVKELEGRLAGTTPDTSPSASKVSSTFQV
jgi:hypothetical protein